LFAAGKAAEAIVEYEKALALAPERGLRCTVLCNRAACYLKLDDYAKCAADCTAALEVEVRVKALFRRAKAWAALGDVEKAFQDAAKCATMDATNAEAVELARDLKGKVTRKLERQGAWQSPTAKVATRIKDGTGQTLEETFRAGAALATNEGASDFWRSGACLVAAERVVLVNDIQAARFLSACCLASEDQVPLDQLLPLGRMGKERIAEAVDNDFALIIVAANVADALNADLRADDDDAGLIEEAQAPSLEDFVADVADAALGLGGDDKGKNGNGNDGGEKVAKAKAKAAKAKAKEGGLDVLAKWLGPAAQEDDAKKKKKKKKKKGLSASSFSSSERGVDVHRAEKRACERLRKRYASRLAKYSLTDDYDGLWVGLWRLLDADDEKLRRKAQGAVARILKAIAAPAPMGSTHDLEFHEDQADLSPRDFLEKLLDMATTAEVEQDDNGGGGSVSKELRERRRRASLVVGYNLASSHLGAKAQQRCFETPVEVMQLIATKDAVAETLGAEVLAAASACEEGRGFLGPLVATGALEALMSDSQMPKAARSAAATAVSRLGLAAKALKAGAAETGRLLEAAVKLCQEEGGDGDDQRTARERGVEVIASLSGNSAVKEEIAHGSSRLAKKCLEALCGAAGKNAKGSDPVAYGIACALSNVTVTNDELRRRHFREKEMEITPEQYDELMRVTKQKADDDRDDDTEELASARRRKVVLADGASLLARLATSGPPSKNTAEKLAETFANLAKDADLRGTLIQQGGFKACVALASADNTQTDACRTNAAHALAKILVTTNPNTLTDAQALSAVRPLLWVCRQFGAFELVHFEACLALTNLLSLGPEAKRRLVDDKGIHALEYLMFSENKMVMRAATEALTNLVPNKTFLAHLKKPDKLKIWLAFARESQGGSGEDTDERDAKEYVAMARAAGGCLAMATSTDDDELCELVAKEQNAPSTILDVLRLDEPSLVHRCAVLVRNLADDPRSRPILLERIPDLAKALRHAKGAFAQVPLVANALLDALTAVEAPPGRHDDDDV